MNIDSLAKMPGIKADMMQAVPKCAKTGKRARQVGFADDEQLTPIYECYFVDHRAQANGKTPLLDHEGNPVRRKYGDNMSAVVMQVPTVLTKRRFTLEDCRDGRVMIHFNFEASEEEKQRDFEAQTDARVEAELKEFIRAGGLAKLQELTGLSNTTEGASTPTEDVPEPFVGAVPVEEVPEYPIDRGRGWWVLSDQSSFRGNREAALEAEAALHEEVIEV